MKFKIYVLIFFALNLIPNQSLAQLQPSYQTVAKYWWYRYRLVNDFMKIGHNCGESIPAEKRFIFNGYWADQSRTMADSVRYSGSLHWGDATEHLGNYIMTLATEYRMLADNGLNTQRTLMELSYALDAFDRLDKNAEDYCDNVEASYPCNPTGNYERARDKDPLNGFFIRDDVPVYNNPVTGDRDFVQQNLQHFNRPAISANYPSGPLPPYNGFRVMTVSDGAFGGRVEVNGQLQPHNTTWPHSKKRMPQEESHDQMVEMYMGTALATRMVDDWATHNGKNLARQAGDAEFRIVRYGALSYNGAWSVPKWRLQNPITTFCVYGTEPGGNCNQGGADISYHGIGASYGLKASAKGVGACTDAQINSIYLGTGAPYEAAYQLAQFASVPNTFTDVKDLVYICTYNAFADYWRAPGICRQPVPTPFGTVYLPYPCIQNTTEAKIRKFCLKYNDMRYPHVPMVYKLISGPGSGHGSVGIDGSEFTGKTWPKLFSEAPNCGCYSYGEYYRPQIDDYGSWWWSGPNWSQDYGKRGDKSTADFNNLDYMYLYNLYNLNDTKYLYYYYNPYYKEKFTVNYPYASFGTNANKIGLNFLEYLSLINQHSSGANLTYRGAKAIDLLPGFKAEKGSNVTLYIKDYDCDNSKGGHYYYASIGGQEITDLAGAHIVGKGTDVSDYDTAGALDLVPYTVVQRDNPNYDPTTIDTSTEESTDPDYLAALQNYKDSLWNVVYSAGDSDLVAKLNAIGIYSTAGKSAPAVKNRSINPTIYPNPTTGEFTISVPEGGWYDVHIYNSFGVEVATDKLEGRQARKISLSSNFPSGTYTVVLLSDGKDRIVKKLVLMR